MSAGDNPGFDFATLLRQAQMLGPSMIALRRELHQQPELGFEERWTALRLAEELARREIEVHTGVGQTGVVGILHGARPGPTVGLRACLDALPVQETTGLPYASRTSGVSHACGHDAQCASLVGAAALLAPLRDRLAGRVAFIFQPAEEIDQGSRAMLEDRLLELVPLEAIFGIHGRGDLPAGTIGLRSGPAMASIDTVALHVRGVGGHGALPHHTVDAVLAASAVVTQLQAVVARTVDPLEPAVISIGTFHAGDTANVVAGTAELTGTVRAASPAVREHLLARIRQVAESTAVAHGAHCEVHFSWGLPPVVNHPLLVTRLRQGLIPVLGPQAFVEPPIVMGGDDFSLFAEHVPGCYLFIGEADPETRHGHVWHASDFNLDERSLQIGAFVLASAALLSLSAATPASDPSDSTSSAATPASQPGLSEPLASGAP